jgi:abortive infection bacteriophage resistance protein
MTELQENYLYEDCALSKLVVSVSEDRLSTYLKLLPVKDLGEALKLYVYNTQLSESFYFPLQGLEVSLRNAIHNELSAHYGADWLYSGSMILHYPQEAKIMEALKKLYPVRNPSKVVAELNLGFWIGLFSRHYEELWRQHLRSLFVNTHKPLLRKDIYKALNNIRLLRNRIAHHEPIIQRDLETDFNSILMIVSMMCDETATWIEAHCRFKGVFVARRLFWV